jgi:hypothetical protein
MLTRKLKPPLGYIVPTVAISPSLIWIAFDRSVWPWDQSLFGKVSVELFFTLVYAPTDWIDQMLHAVGGKAPGVSWFGQFFVPLGYLLGSIDVGLLLSIWVTQALTLTLFYQSIRELSSHNELTGVMGCVMLASAPLFVAMSHEYFAEPLQLLAVTWFVMIMSFVPSWKRAVILSHLAMAATVAMLAKVTSPLYCLGPGLLALCYLFKRTASPGVKPEWLQMRVITVIAVGVLMGLATIGWYYTNIGWVIQHASDSSFGSIVEMYWGKKGSFVKMMSFWLEAFRASFFLTSVLLISAVILGFSVLSHLIRGNTVTKHFTRCSAVAALQVVLVLAVFSLSPTKDTRYLLPLLPYVALLICWGVAQINKPILTSLVTLLFSLQLLSTYGQAFGIIPITSSSGLRPPNSDRKNATVLNSVVTRTCDKNGSRYWNVFGIELPWLNRESAGYFAAKNLAPHNRLGCYYGTVRIWFSDLDKIWSDMLSLQIHYYISMRPDPDPVASDWHSQLINQNYRPMLEKVQTSPLFELEPPVVEDSAVLIFRGKQVVFR